MSISKQHVLIGTLVLSILTGTMAMADANHHRKAVGIPSTPAAIRLTDAIQKAQAAVPGTVISAELANEHTKAVYQVEIASLDKSGKTTEVLVSATNGAILASHASPEDDDSNEGESSNK